MKVPDRENSYQIAIVFTDGSRVYYDVSCIKILEGCLVIVDPIDMIPCEIHCFPFTSIKSFIFDAEAAKNHVVNIWVPGISAEPVADEEPSDSPHPES